MSKQLSSNDLASGETDGFVVVAVLWILATLAALISIYAVFIVNAAVGFAAYDDRFRAEELASAAAELTTFRYLSNSLPARPSDQKFRFKLQRSDVFVNYKSEAARIDLNNAPKDLLVGLFVSVGESRSAAEVYSDRIIAWRAPAINNQDTESSAYRAAGFAYGPRGTNFPHVDELMLVRDLPAETVQRISPLVTVYSGHPQVNILEASPQVLAALPGISPEGLNMLLARRQLDTENGADLLPLLGGAQPYASTESSRALRISVHVLFESGRQANCELVILVFDQGEKPFGVLSWSSELPVAPKGVRSGSF